MQLQKKNAFVSMHFLAMCGLFVVLAAVLFDVVKASMPKRMGVSIDSEKRNDTRYNISQIEKALQAFYFKQKRIPCPSSDPSTGLESYSSNSCVANENVISYLSSQIFVGEIPFKTLGIQEYLKRDGWGKPIKYGVYYLVTKANTTISGSAGNVTVSNNVSSITLNGGATSSIKAKYHDGQAAQTDIVVFLISDRTLQLSETTDLQAPSYTYSADSSNNVNFNNISKNIVDSDIGLLRADKFL